MLAWTEKLDGCKSTAVERGFIQPLHTAVTEKLKAAYTSTLAAYTSTLRGFIEPFQSLALLLCMCSYMCVLILLYKCGQVAWRVTAHARRVVAGEFLTLPL